MNPKTIFLTLLVIVILLGVGYFGITNARNTANDQGATALLAQRNPRDIKNPVPVVENQQKLLENNNAVLPQGGGKAEDALFKNTYGVCAEKEQLVKKLKAANEDIIKNRRVLQPDTIGILSAVFKKAQADLLACQAGQKPTKTTKDAAAAQ